MAAAIEETFNSFIQCINEERWPDLVNYVAFPLNLNEENIADPRAFADRIHAAGRLRLDIDAVTVDERTEQLAATSLGTMELTKGGRDQTIQFMEQYIILVEGGKITQLNTIPDDDEIVRQVSSPSESSTSEPSTTTTPDLIRNYEIERSSSNTAAAVSEGEEARKKKLSAAELENTYRAYIACINAQSMEAELPRFCHDHVTHNARRLPLAGYRRLIQDTFDAIPDVFFNVSVVVADERAQRVAARLQFSGIPTGPLAGAEPTGRSVHFCEFVTYAFRDGKIDRVWSIVDWASYRWQLSQ